MEKDNNNRVKLVKLMCSYGGKIQSRSPDHQLTYTGGDTKILAVDRAAKFSEIIAKLNSLSNKNKISVKYQLPGEGLDSLVSLINDEDVEHMMEEYDRMHRISAATPPPRLRVFIFDKSGPPVKSAPVNPDYLFGFDKEYQPSVEPPPTDFLPIPGMFPPENHMTGGATAAQVVYYRVPAVVGGGGVYNPYGVVLGNREQPVYNFVPNYQ